MPITGGATATVTATAITTTTTTTTTKTTARDGSRQHSRHTPRHAHKRAPSPSGGTAAAAASRASSMLPLHLGRLYRLPTRLRRRVRRNRMATLATLAALVGLLVLPLYSAYCVYRPPGFLIAYLRARYPDVLFEVTLPPARTGAGAGAGDDKLIALSLDDAPSVHTVEIMQILRDNAARATFFVIGAQLDGREHTLRQLVRQGHELANHGMRDEPSTALSDARLEADVDAVQAKLVDVYADAYDEASAAHDDTRLGRLPPRVLPNNYFRPGSGFFHRRMRALLGRRGFRIVLGSVYPHDAQIPSPRLNARHVLAMAHPGAIIICHDRRAWTPPMLRLVLPELRRRGYRVVTITDLVKAAELLAGQR